MSAKPDLRRLRGHAAMARWRHWLRHLGQASWRDSTATAPAVRRPLLHAADAAALIALAQSAGSVPRVRPVGQRQAGDRASAWRGQGLDYVESRLYQPGDDLRDLHWRLLARTGKPYVKLHEEEHAPAWHVLLDLRPRMAFGTRQRTKAEQAARMALLACAAHALGAGAGGGRIGLTLWQALPPSGAAQPDSQAAIAQQSGTLQSSTLPCRAAAVRQLAMTLQQLRVTAPADAASRPEAAHRDAAEFADWAQRLARRLPEGSTVVLVSDGAGWDTPAVDAAWWALRQRAEVLLLRVLDPVESALPPGSVMGAASLFDLAAGQAGRAPVDAQSLRGAFAARAGQYHAARLAHWRSAGLRCIEAGTQQPDSRVLHALQNLC